MEYQQQVRAGFSLSGIRIVPAYTSFERRGFREFSGLSAYRQVQRVCGGAGLGDGGIYACFYESREPLYAVSR